MNKVTYGLRAVTSMAMIACALVFCHAANPKIEYSVDCNDDNYRLFATVDGEKVFIATDYGLFGDESYLMTYIEAQEDFDGDGIVDALVCSPNIGSAGGSSWVFVSYAGNKRFRKSKVMSIPPDGYAMAELSKVNGKKVLDFYVVDLGKKVVRERYGLKDGKAVSMSVPTPRFPLYVIMKTIDMEDFDNGKSLVFDFDDDGVNEKVTSTGSYHFGRSLVLEKNGKKYEFGIGTLYGVGELHVLASKTNGMHDIMSEHDIRTIYKWDGTTYK